jgi:hypothetical protein
MRRKFIQALVAVLAVIAVFGFVYPDDLSDYDVAGQSEMVTESPERLPSPRDQQAIDSSLLTAISKSTCSPGSDASARTGALVSLSTSVLRCWDYRQI